MFGGSYGNTYLNQIDAFNDYLALAGRTFDSKLAGITLNFLCVPFIALSSIATSGKYYWAKAFTL
jgi:hypothetical protein